MKFLILFLLFQSCSTNDELKNSKKLIKKGHVSLYQQGAFRLPHSSVKIIPAGPKVFTLSSQLSTVKAKDSFYVALEKAKESYLIIKKGTLASYNISKDKAQKWNELTDVINKHSRENSIWLIKRSYAKSLGIIQKGHKKSIKDSKKLIKLADQSLDKSLFVAKEFEHKINQRILKEDKKSETELLEIKKRSTKRKTLDKGWNQFVLGYLSLPDKLQKEYSKTPDKLTIQKMNKRIYNSNKLRKKYSNYSWGLIHDSIVNYSQNKEESIKKAKDSLKEDEYGSTFAMFSYLGWMIDAHLWQGLIKPLGQISAGAVGYIVSNGVVYPVLLTTDAALSTGDLIVEYSKALGKSAFHITAPTFKLALSSVFAAGESLYDLTDFMTSKLGKPVKKASLHTAKVLGKTTIKVAGFSGKVLIKYIAVPLTYVGENVLASSTGVVVGTVGALGGLSYAAVGETLKQTSPIVEGSTIGVGTTVGALGSAAYGATVMAYHGATAVVVPSTQILTSGVVLTYGMLSQLSAQTILAMGDMAYIVLSLEGPKWVIYGIKGKIDKANHPQGAVINLKKLQEKGEVIKKIELNEKEVDNLLN